MSTKNVNAFFERVEVDRALQVEITALHKKAKENLDGAIAELVKTASAAGFEFTADDYAEARTHQQTDTELSARELKMVGGCNSNWTCARVKTI